MPPPEMPGLPDGPSVHDLENSMKPPGQPINLFDALATGCPVHAEMGPEPCREPSLPVEALKASGHEISIFQALSTADQHLHVEAWQAFLPALPLVSPLPLGSSPFVDGASPPFVEHTQLLLPELMHLPVAPVEGCEPALPLIPEAGDDWDGSFQMTPRGNSEAERIVKDVLSPPPMSPDIFMNTTPQKWLEYSPGVARSKTSASALGHYRLAVEDAVKRKMWI